MENPLDNDKILDYDEHDGRGRNKAHESDRATELQDLIAGQNKFSGQDDNLSYHRGQDLF